MATHSGTLAWKIPWTEEPGRLQSMGSQSESESHSIMSASLQSHGLYSPWNSPGQNTRMGNLSLLQRIFPTQGSNPGLPQCRQILYQLSHKGSPRTLEWVVYPFSSRSSQPRNQTRVSCIAGRFFTNWAMGKPFFQITNYPNISGINILLSFLTHITDLSHKTNVNVKWVVIFKRDSL